MNKPDVLSDEELGKHRRRTSKHVVNYITINHKNWNALKEKMK